MEIVQFKNGKYGIRKWNWIDRLFGFEGSFLDLNYVGEIKLRSSSDDLFNSCQSSDLELVKTKLKDTLQPLVVRVIELPPSELIQQSESKIE